MRPPGRRTPDVSRTPRIVAKTRAPSRNEKARSKNRTPGCKGACFASDSAQARACGIEDTARQPDSSHPLGSTRKTGLLAFDSGEWVRDPTVFCFLSKSG